MRKLLKGILIFFASIVSLVFLILFLIYLPIVQEKAVDYASKLLKNKLGYNISVEKFELGFPLDIIIKNLEVKDSLDNSLLHLSLLNTEVKFLPLFKGDVKSDSIIIRGVSTDTKDMLSALHLNGHLDEFSIINPIVNLKRSEVSVPQINIIDSDIAMSILMTSEKKDTTESNPINWSFKIDNVNIKNIKYILEMPKDTMYLSTYIESLELNNGFVDLYNMQYSTSNLYLNNSSYEMKMGNIKAVNGFNPNDFNFNNINIEIDSFYMKDLDIDADIRKLTVKENDKFNLKDFSAIVYYKPDFIKVRDLNLITSDSKIQSNVDLDFNIFKGDSKQDSYIDLSALIGPKDLQYFVGAYIPDSDKLINDNSLVLETHIKSKQNTFYINNTGISFGELIKTDLEGNINFAKEIKALKSALSLNAVIKPDPIINNFIPSDKISLPKEIILNTNINTGNSVVNTATELSYNKSHMNLDGFYNIELSSYELELKANNLDIKSIVRDLDIPTLSFDLKAEGEKFDFLSSSCYLNLFLDVNKFVFRDFSMNDLKMKAVLDKSKYDLNLSVVDTLGNINLKTLGVLDKKDVMGNLVLTIDSLNLMTLGLAKEKTLLSFDSKSDFYTDYLNKYKLNLVLDSIQFDLEDKIQKIRDINIDFISNIDSTYLEVNNGDLNVMAMINESIDKMTKSSTSLIGLIDKMVEKKDINILKIKESLPEVFMQITSGNNNLLNGILKSNNIYYSSFNAIMINESDRPMMLSFEMPDFKTSSLQLNNTYLSFEMDTIANFDIVTNKDGKEKIEKMDIKVLGEISDNNVNIQLKQKDGNGNIGFDFGFDTALKGDTISLSFDTINTTILYIPWKINNGNYIDYSFNNRVKADLLMEAPGGLSIYVNSNDTTDIPGKIALNAGIRNFNIEKFIAPFTDLPRFQGMVNVDIYGEALKDSVRAELNIDINDFVYDKKSLLPINLNGTFYSAPGLGYNIDSKILYNKVEISALEASIKENDNLSAYLQLLEFPAEIANPFIPQDMASLSGFFNGNVKATGKISEPLINGEIFFDNTIVNIGYANANLNLADNKISFDNSVVKFDNFKIYAYNKNPLLINGNFDIRDFNKMYSNLRITGDNVELINVRKQKNKMIYGKLFMDINTQVRGPVEMLKVTGNVNLLGGSDFTYVLLDSPLSAQNRVGNLVEFTNFNDTLQLKNDTKINSLMSGIDIALNLSIAPSVQVGIDLAANGSDRVELIGGGDLAFLMSPQGDMEMNGRYELSGGFVRYNLPVLPVSKTFDIQNGSYVEWKGNLLDPYINITAAEKIRTTVTEEDKGSRVVNFDAMIKIFNTLNNLEIAFDLSAPDDMTIQNQLASMTSEERGKQAISLIVTKMYTGPGTTAKLNSNNALTAFIQKEINQFAGDNLKGVDISFGIDSYDQYGSGGESGTRTDYSFRFSKKFFNDRFKIVVGGTVSSGQDPAQQDNQSFINDIILEYTLDKSGTRYLKLFHHTNNESLLEGEIIETGIGIVLKRKVRKVRQLFIFNEEKRRRRIEQDPELIKQ